MKRVGIQEIARLAKVSIGTVDRALHGRKRINDHTRQRILKIAQRVGYKPNLAARALSSGRASLRIGICIPQEIHFYFDQLRDGILAEARRFEHLGVEVIYHPTKRLGFREVETVSKLVNDGIQALIIAPGNPQELASAIEDAEKKKDIRVVCVDTDAPDSFRSAVVCLDAEIAGRLAAELMGGLVKPGSKVAVITGMLKTEDHRKKTKGFIEAFAGFCSGGKVIEVVEAHDDENEALWKCAALLEKHPSLAGIYVGTGICLPVCRVLCARELSGKIKLITTDLFKEMVPYFKAGTISASINGRPHIQGQMAMRLIVDHLVQKRPFVDHYYLPPEIVMRSTLHLFLEISESMAAIPASLASPNSSSL
ncbi:MAG: substrate-binding domain-containing protein [Terriglobia bacterium]